MMAAFESLSVALRRSLALIKGLNPTIVVVLESVSIEALKWNNILVQNSYIDIDTEFIFHVYKETWTLDQITHIDIESDHTHENKGR